MIKGNVFFKFLFLTIITLLFFISFILNDFVHIAKAATIQNNCLNCHLGLQAIQSLSAQQWTNSVHASASVCCEDCHGGDPNSPYKPEIGKNGFIGVPVKRKIPYLCDTCHANPRYMKKYNIRVDKESQYKDSIHGQRLLKEGNMDVADCVDCHGNHEIRITDDPKSRVNHLNIAETCAKCHADTNFMRPYGIPTDQLTQYKKSHHGKILYKKIEGKNSRLVPSCPGCHGIHGGTPSGVNKVADACYNCHLKTKRYFRKSVHSLILEENQFLRCIDCHGFHNILATDEDLFIGQKASHCGHCHPLNSKENQIGQKIRSLLLEAKAAVEKSEDKINGIKRDLDIDASGFDQKMRYIFDYYIEARRAVHSQDIGTVKPIVQKIHKYTHELIQQIDNRYREIRQRKKWLVQVLFFISLLFSFIAYQRSRLKK